MDDDIRSRFRSPGSRPASRYNSWGPPVTPAPRQQSRPQPRPQPVYEEEDEPWLPERPQKVKKAKRKKTSFGRKLKKLFFWLIFLAIIGAGTFGGFLLYQKWKDQQKSQSAAIDDTASTNTASNNKQPALSGTITIMATGDTLAYNSINAAAKQSDGSYNYAPMMASIKPLFDKADVRYCDEASPAAGDSFGISGFPSFNAPFALSKGLVDTGCNVVNIGSDHTNDKGQAAIDALVNDWQARKDILAYTGANKSAVDQNTIHYFKVKGATLAVVSFVTTSAQPTTFGVNVYSDSLAEKLVAEARKNARIVIVGMHWGTEDSQDTTPAQEAAAQKLADLKADIVIGSGPHVVQPAKVLNGPDGHQTLIWYSLGNFLNSQINTNNLFSCAAVMTIELPSFNMKNPSCLPLYMHYEWTAAQAKNHGEADLAARHNFALYPLDKAAEPLSKSQNGTTVQAQTDRIKAIITKFAPIKMITSADL